MKLFYFEKSRVTISSKNFHDLQTSGVENFQNILELNIQ